MYNIILMDVRQFANGRVIVYYAETLLSVYRSILIMTQMRGWDGSTNDRVIGGCKVEEGETGMIGRRVP